MSYDSPVAMGHPMPPINQCDGCRVGAPYTKTDRRLQERFGIEFSPLHQMPDGGYMGCTKGRYEEKDDGKEV